jgi:hypothetical protein
VLCLWRCEMRRVGVHVEGREICGDAMFGGAHRGNARKRPASRWRCFKRKYVFFPGEGLKGSEGTKYV